MYFTGMLNLSFLHVLLGFRWEKYQTEEEAALGRGKRLRKAVSYREAYAPHPNETLSEVLLIASKYNEYKAGLLLKMQLINNLFFQPEYTFDSLGTFLSNDSADLSKM